jgi:ATP-dependent Clp protease ATP-binding subunit ClpC
MRHVAPLRAPHGGTGSPPTDSGPRSSQVQAASDLGALRREAENIAKERKERLGTTHVLVALATRGGLPADLLAEQRVSRDLAVKTLRVAVDDDKEPVDRLMMHARDLAGRSRRMTTTGPDVDGTHVLLAICSERNYAAHKALLQLGVDVARLRGKLMQHVTGSVEPRRRVQTNEVAAEAPKPPTRTGHAPPPSHGGASSGHQMSAMRALTTLRPLPSRAPTQSSPPPAPVAPEPTSRTIETAPTAATGALADAGIIDGEELRPSAPPPPKLPKNVRRGRETQKALAEPTRFDLDPKTAPTLCALGINLTAAAARGELDPVVGRDAEVDRTLDVLAKRNANNPCLLGVPGVGKTAIAYGVARRIAAIGSVSSGSAGAGVAGLDDRIVVELPIGELLAGTGVRGALAERIGAIRKEVAAARGRIVVFLDEIHALVGGDAGEEAANELKTALARGELPCIGATTPAEYRRTIERDAALARRFSVVEVGELDPTAAKSVIDAACGTLASHHGVAFEPGAREGSIAWTVRYLPSRALPDKAIAALDLAGARARRNGRKAVSREHLAQVVAEMADVPVARLLERDADRFLELEKHLSARVVGHGEAMKKIARALRRGAAGLRGNRPLFTSLLLGPTGVGKTETAKAIAEVLFHDPTAMTRIDLSEYSEQHAVARLVGAPPGYVGHEDGGQLTEAVRRRPYQVVLFDEMEKAHRDVLEALLQLLDEGRMTDGRGRTIDFTNTVVVLTSNLGSEVAAESRPKRLGFGHREPEEKLEEEASRRDAAIIASARASLPPELFNRFDEVIVFGPLTRKDAVQIARIALDRLSESLRASRGLSLQVDSDAIELILDAGGFDPSLGGRPIRREIGRMVEAPLAELLLRGETSPGDVVWVTVEDGRVVVDLVK